MTCYNTAKLIVQRLHTYGHTTYLAGGYVRDMLMGLSSDDIDIATSATSEEVMALFPKTIPVGVQFGIIIVVENGIQFEVATFRKDAHYHDGRRPKSVEKTTPEIDAERRDFTINGMFYDPLKDELIDYVSGKEDLQKKIIRAIGDPHKRMEEDRLRMIRCIRYAARFKFTIDKATEEAVLAHASELFPAVAIERVWNELCKMNNFEGFEKALCLLHKFTLLREIFPDLSKTPLKEIQKCAQFIAMHPPSSPLIAKIYELFPKKSLRDKLALCSYLKLSNEEKSFTEDLEHLSLAKNLDSFGWAKLYSSAHIDTQLEILAIHQRPEWLIAHKERIHQLQKDIKLLKKNERIVTSKHLLDLGIKAGPKMGHLLEKSMQIAINHKIYDPYAILDILMKDVE